jgi:single-strand DNA-binding protein
MRNLKNDLRLIGNLGKDAEVKSFNSGKALISFTMGVNSSYPNAAGEKVETVDWFTVEKWFNDIKAAEKIAKYLTKSQRVEVAGEVKIGSYDKQVGSEIIKIPTITVMMDQFLLMGGSNASSGQSVSEPA